MAQCAACGNDYGRTFSVTTHDGRVLEFDCVECAAHLVAPICAWCGIRVLGHGVESDDLVFCCASCARQEAAERT